MRNRLLQLSPLRKIQTFLDILGSFKWMFLGVLSVMLVSSLLTALGVGMILPIVQLFVGGGESPSGISGWFLSFVQNVPPEKRFLYLGIVLMILMGARGVFFVLEAAYSAYFAQRLRESWTDDVGRRYLFGEYSYISGMKQGVLLNNILREPFMAARCITFSLQCLSAAIMTVPLFALTLVVDWKLVLAFSIVCGAIILLFRGVTFRFSTTLGSKRILLWQKITAQATENTSAIRQIKAFSMELERHRVVMALLHRLSMLNVKLQAANKAPPATVEFVVITFFVGYIFIMSAYGNVPIQELVPTIAFFLVAFNKLFANISRLFAMRMKALNGLPSLMLVDSLCKEAPKPEDLGKGLALEKIETDLLMRNLDFSYSKGVCVFENLSIVFPKGKVSFLIGPSGAGKTTLVNLLLRLYEPSAGIIQVNDRNIADYRLADWRGKIGYVSQDVMLLNGTVRENILFGQPDASEKRVIEAAELAGAHEFIMRMPKGYDTRIGDRGLTVSGGQRQRITIARALIRNPEILILDEATSSLDQEMEREILESLKEVNVGRTVIHISHRLASAAYADVIYILEGGKIVRTGSYEDLIDQNGAALRPY